MKKTLEKCIWSVAVVAAGLVGAIGGYNTGRYSAKPTEVRLVTVGHKEVTKNSTFCHYHDGVKVIDVSGKTSVLYGDSTMRGNERVYKQLDPSDSCVTFK